MIDTILKMSATGAVVIGVVLALRLCLRRAPKFFSYVLWLIVLFRLLCPVSVALTVSVFNLMPTAQKDITDQLPAREHPGNENAILAESTGIAGEGSGTSKEDVVIEDSSVSGHLAESQAAMEVTSLWSWKNIAFCIWVAGVCAMAGYAVVSVLQLHKKLKHASLDRENIYLLEGIASPFVAGIIRPKIYLPCGLEEHERTYILLHEQTHIRRGDPLFRVLGYVALTLHWFNPLVWVAFFLSGRDMEMSCDEMVLRRLGEKIRCDYSDSLLAMAQGKGVIGFTPLAFGEGDTGKRIKNVLNYKKVTVQTLVISALVVALAGIALGADAMEDTPESGQTQEIENRDTSGEYSFYVYSLGAENGAFTQIAGSRIEWNQTGSLIYEPDEMLMFFHELGHYLYNSHLLVGMEDLKIRTDPVCDEDHYTYKNFAPTCFPDPYEGLDVR